MCNSPKTLKSRVTLTLSSRIVIGCCTVVILVALYALMQVVRNNHYESRFKGTTSYDIVLPQSVRQRLSKWRLDWISNNCDRIWPPVHAQSRFVELNPEDVAILLDWHKGWKHLSFAGSNLSNKDATQLSALQSLEYLNIRWTELNGDGVRSFASSKNLTCLLLDGLPIADSDVEYIVSTHRAIRLLGLAKTRVTCESVSHLRRLSELRGVDLSCCDLIIPEAETFSRLPSLVYIHLDSRLATENIVFTLKKSSPSIAIHIENCSPPSSFDECGAESEHIGPGF